MSIQELSLTELERFDRGAWGRSAPGDHQGERRFCCPLPACGGKRIDAAHRCLAVDLRTGAWYCHRCHEGGKLLEWRESQADAARRQRQQDGPRFPVYAPAPPDQSWRKKLRGMVVKRIEGTPGAAYLRTRGLHPEIAARSGARFCPSWMGRKAVLFPVRDSDGRLVAVHGRYTDGRQDPKARTLGNRREGVYSTAGALSETVLVIAEGPMDALSLAECGLPAVALLGTDWPIWLTDQCWRRRVLLATDADAAGDAAAERLAQALAPYAARIDQLRPGAGMKDWNEMLQSEGPGRMKGALLEALIALGIPPAESAQFPRADQPDGYRADRREDRIA